MAMTKKAKVDLLHKAAIFSGVPDRTLGTIADQAEVIDFPAGHYIVRQGQVGTGFYLLASGRASVTRGGETLARLGPGDFFGELSVIDQMPRTAHVVTEEPTTCLALASWNFMKLLEEHPKIALSVLREVARRLRAGSDSPRY
ncbi:MAG: Crp/Fnr family transcriptional regulator [Armatimonadota bacterium]